MTEALTGRRRYRVIQMLWSSKLVLQVEESFNVYNVYVGSFVTKTRWRDAVPEDLLVEKADE